MKEERKRQIKEEERIRKIREERRRKDREEKRKLARRKKLLAAGFIVAGGTAVAIGSCGKEEQRTDRSEPYEYTTEEPTKASTERMEETVEENTIFEEIVDIYNNKYPETPISEEDMSIIKTKEPAYLIKQTNDDGTITYIYDFKSLEELKENQEFKKDNLGTIYTVVNKADKSTILSLGLVDNNVEEIVPNRVFINSMGARVEYSSNGKTVELPMGSEADKAINYGKLEDKLIEIIEQKEAEQQAKLESEDDYEIGD